MEQEKYLTVDESDLKGVVRTNLDSPEPTKAQLERKRKSIERVKRMGLPYNEHLPVVEDEYKIETRTPEEVAKRCIAVVLCAIKGEILGKDQPFINELVMKYNAQPYFSPKEAIFIKDSSPQHQDLVDFSWRYECVHIFLWALGRLDELKPPNVICDVSHEVGLIRDAGPDTFIKKAKLRGQSEILDMADFYYHLHWAAIELRLKGRDSDKVDEGIIRERHRALNWLIKYLNQDWDDVTTDT